MAFVFPGQGSQYTGMGKSLAENFSAAREVFEAADEALGFSVSRLCFEGPEEALQLTENTQPALLTASVAAFRALEAEGFPAPAYVAGHSLGEYSALVAAGALSLGDAVRTVRARGEYMQEAVPIGTGAMAAVLGCSLEQIRLACHEASQGEVCSPANLNSPGQVVIAGNAGAVDRASELLKLKGAKRVIKLNVSAPFHCGLMMPAQTRLADFLATIEIADAQTPVVVNADAEASTSGSELRAALVRQVSAPVRWLESMQFLLLQGVNRFVEVGPGKVLSGLMRQIDRGAEAVNVEDAATLTVAREKVLV